MSQTLQQTERLFDDISASSVIRTALMLQSTGLASNRISCCHPKTQLLTRNIRPYPVTRRKMGLVMAWRVSSVQLQLNYNADHWSAVVTNAREKPNDVEAPTLAVISSMHPFFCDSLTVYDKYIISLICVWIFSISFDCHSGKDHYSVHVRFVCKFKSSKSYVYELLTNITCTIDVRSMTMAISLQTWRDHLINLQKYFLFL